MNLQGKYELRIHPTSAKVWRGASGPGRTSTFLVIPVVTGLTRGGYDGFGIIPEIAPG